MGEWTELAPLGSAHGTRHDRYRWRIRRSAEIWRQTLEWGPRSRFSGIVLNWNREMKGLKKVRWLTLLAALGLLSVGIDRMFFDRIVGVDPLARIERTLAI